MRSGTPTNPTTIIRTERGLTIAGTRVTLYDVLGYLRAEWSRERLAAILRLSNEQVDAALDYIAAHRIGVEAEYALVLQSADEARQYWEARNRERLAQIAAASPRPGTEALRATLAQRAAERAARDARNVPAETMPEAEDHTPSTSSS